MAARAPGVVIGRAELAAPADQGVEARRAALASLDAAVWPRSGEAEDAWLFVRGIEVAAPAWQLGATAAGRASALDAEAVDGWRAGPGDAAVRFASRADVLARLSRDLAAGTADGFWFWRVLLADLPRDAPWKPIAALWSEEVTRVAEIVARLDARGALAPVMAALGEAGAGRVLAALARETGWPVAAVPVEDDGVTALALPQAVERAADHLGGAVGGVLSNGAAVRLLALVALWRGAPHMLLTPTRAAVSLATVMRRLRGERPAGAAGPAQEAPAPAREERGGGPMVFPPSADPDDRPALPPGGEARSDDGEGSDDTPAPPVDLAPPPAGPPHPGGDVEAPGTPGELNATHRESASPPPVEEQEVTTEETAALRVMTRFGGVFFLLNVLNLPQVRPILESAPAPGWHRLWRLALPLGFAPDAALARFLAAELDLTGPAALCDLPPLPREEEILAAAERRYAPLGVWDADLLARPAAVRATLTHVDVDLHHEGARLDVRRAGLDVDPGWLPWLGRVVAFHYVDDPALQALGDAP